MKPTAPLLALSAVCVGIALIAPQAIAAACVVACIALSTFVIASWVRGFQSDANLWRTTRRRRPWRHGWWRRPRTD
jgi:hypothetical protein